MKNGRDGLVQQINKDLKDKRVYTIIGAAYWRNGMMAGNIGSLVS
jgi:hypothetical protein